MTDEIELIATPEVAAIVGELQKIIDNAHSSAGDKLKAIDKKVELLGLSAGKGSGKLPASEPEFDADYNRVMADPIIRKKAAELAAKTQNAIDRLRR